MFKTIFDKIYLFFYRAFFCFTFITMAMAVFGKLMNTDELYKYMAVKQLFTFFVFSLLFALSFTVADFIKNNVIIYANASILGGNTIIGNNCVIGGNVFITSSIDDNKIVTFEKENYKIRDRSNYYER